MHQIAPRRRCCLVRAVADASRAPDRTAASRPRRSDGPPRHALVRRHAAAAAGGFKSRVGATHFVRRCWNFKRQKQLLLGRNGGNYANDISCLKPCRWTLPYLLSGAAAFPVDAGAIRQSAMDASAVSVLNLPSIEAAVTSRNAIANLRWRNYIYTISRVAAGFVLPAKFSDSLSSKTMCVWADH